MSRVQDKLLWTFGMVNMIGLLLGPSRPGDHYLCSSKTTDRGIFKSLFLHIYTVFWFVEVDSWDRVEKLVWLVIVALEIIDICALSWQSSVSKPCLTAFLLGEHFSDISSWNGILWFLKLVKWGWGNRLAVAGGTWEAGLIRCVIKILSLPRQA